MKVGVGVNVGVRVQGDAGARQEPAAVEPDEVRRLRHLGITVVIGIGIGIRHRYQASVSGIVLAHRISRRTSGTMPGTCSCTKSSRYATLRATCALAASSHGPPWVYAASMAVVAKALPYARKAGSARWLGLGLR